MPVDQVLLQEISEVLQSEEINAKEREIFENAQQGMLKKEYYLKVAGDLKTVLTPIVVRREASQPVSEFYMKHLSPDFTSKGLGGLITFSGPGLGW
ncbi:bacteriocin immunity protein [Lactovum odontotermitis]